MITDNIYNRLHTIKFISFQICGIKYTKKKYNKLNFFVVEQTMLSLWQWYKIASSRDAAV